MDAVRRFAASFTLELFQEKVSSFKPELVTREEFMLLRGFHSQLQDSLGGTGGEQFLKFTWVFTTALLRYLTLRHSRHDGLERAQVELEDSLAQLCRLRERRVRLQEDLGHLAKQLDYFKNSNSFLSQQVLRLKTSLAESYALFSLLLRFAEALRRPRSRLRLEEPALSGQLKEFLLAAVFLVELAPLPRPCAHADLLAQLEHELRLAEPLPSLL